MKSSEKNVRVILVGEAKEEYEELNNIVCEELRRGKRGTYNQTLFNSIKQKIEFLKQDPQFGIQIRQKMIPKSYIRNYEINNLWKINLPGAWRMLYTIRSNEIEIIAIVLDILSHKRYDKKLGYRKR